MIHQPPETNLKAYLRRCCTQGVYPHVARDLAFDLMIAGSALDSAARLLRANCQSRKLKVWLGAFLTVSGPNPPLTKLED